MPNQTCTQRLKVCHLRILRLDTDGTILDGDDVRYESKAPIQLQYTPQGQDREEIEQLNGCGDRCGFFIGDPNAIDSAEMQIQLCDQDAEILELLAGGEIIDDATAPGNTIGYLSPTDDTVNVGGVAIETWSYQWNRNQRALRNGSPGWYRHVFAKTTWMEDQQTLGNEFGVLQLSGRAEVNSGFGTGWDEDPIPVAIGSSVYGWFLDDSKPDSECGYLSIPSA